MAQECDMCGQEAEGVCARCGTYLCESCVYFVGEDAVCDQCMSDAEYAAYLDSEDE